MNINGVPVTDEMLDRMPTEAEAELEAELARRRMARLTEAELEANRDPWAR